MTAYPTEPCVNKGDFADLFTPPSGGGRISSPEAWPACGRAWRDLIVETEYGGMPPAPEGIEVEALCHSGVRRWPGSPKLWTVRVHCLGGARPLAITVQLVIPGDEDAGPFPAIIRGDGCWWMADPEAIPQRVVEHGCALVLFNRTEVAEDLGYGGNPDKTRRAGGLYDAYPGGTFGAVAAWAWGYHRVVDLLMTLPFIDSQRIAVSGHSRGGKTTLLAGATDGRIALVNDNASGAGGGAAFRYVGHGGETLGVIVDAFPSWFGPAMQDYRDREEALPFDQHGLLSAIAPRALLQTYALDDRWSNPEGMVQCARAAREVYRFLGAEQRLAFHLRPGGHSHSLEDWDALLGFIGRQWFGQEPRAAFNEHPYDHLPPLPWSAPTA